MNFVSCLKSVCMRIEVGTLPWLMTEDKDIPILRVAMAYTAHEEPLLRTQARSAMLTLLSKIKMGEGPLLRTALDMAKSRKLGWVIGKSWHWTWHVMSLHWREELSELCHVLSHLSFWSICFLKGDLLLAPSDSPGCQPHCAHCCGRIGARWHKQRKRGMLPFFRNGHSLRRTVYPIPKKGWRDGGGHNATFSKAKSEAFAKSVFSNSFWLCRRNDAPWAGCAVLYPQISVPKWCSWPRLFWSRQSMRSIQQWPTPWQGCQVSEVGIARIAAGPLGPLRWTDQARHPRHHTDGLWCHSGKSGLEIGILDSHKGCRSESLERSLCEAFEMIQQRFFGTGLLRMIGKWI